MNLKNLVRRLTQGDMGSYGTRWRKSLWLVFLFTLSQLILAIWAHIYAIEWVDRSAAYKELFSVARYLLPRFMGWGMLFSLLYALPQRALWRRLLGVVFTVLLVGLFAYEAFLIRMYHVLYNESVADIMLSTNSREGAEYLASLWGSWDFQVVLLSVAGVGVLTVGVAYLLRFLEPYWKRWTRIFFGVGLLLMAMGVGTLEYWGYVQYTSRYTVSTVRSSSIERLLWSTKFALLAADQVAFAQLHMKETFEHISLSVEDPVFTEPVHIVLILGESTTTRYMHSYGYPLETTPRLDSLERAGEVIRFSDVVSPASSTILSNTRSLTYYTMEEGSKPWYEYPTLIGALQKAGYYTAWVTAQDAMGIHSMVRTFGLAADTLLGTPGTLPEEVSDYYGLDLPERVDGQLLPLLRHLKDVPAGRGKRGLFEVLHLMGCHESYRERYPKVFNRFKPEDIGTRQGNEERKYIAEYLNAVYYNDYVVSEIMSQYKEEPVLLFYFADHGEVVYNDPKRPDFKGRSDKRVGVSVPFYVYMSPSLRAAHPELWQQMQAAKDYPYETDLFTHTLTGLLGIKTKYSQPRYELFSPQYDTKRPRSVFQMGRGMMPLEE